MTSTEARIDVLAAAVRALAQSLPPEHATLTASRFLRHAAALGRERLSDHADQVAAAEVAAVMMALAK